MVKLRKLKLEEGEELESSVMNKVLGGGDGGSNWSPSITYGMPGGWYNDPSTGYTYDPSMQNATLPNIDVVASKSEGLRQREQKEEQDKQQNRDAILIGIESQTPA